MVQGGEGCIVLILVAFYVVGNGVSGNRLTGGVGRISWKRRLRDIKLHRTWTDARAL